MANKDGIATLLGSSGSCLSLWEIRNETKHRELVDRSKVIIEEYGYVFFWHRRLQEYGTDLKVADLWQNFGLTSQVKNRDQD